MILRSAPRVVGSVRTRAGPAAWPLCRRALSGIGRGGRCADGCRGGAGDDLEGRLPPSSDAGGSPGASVLLIGEPADDPPLGGGVRGPQPRLHRPHVRRLVPVRAIVPAAHVADVDDATPKITGIAERGGSPVTPRVPDRWRCSTRRIRGTLASNSEFEIERYLHLGDVIAASTSSSRSRGEGDPTRPGYFVTWVTTYVDGPARSWAASGSASSSSSPRDPRDHRRARHAGVVGHPVGDRLPTSRSR